MPTPGREISLFVLESASDDGSQHLQGCLPDYLESNPGEPLLQCVQRSFIFVGCSYLVR